MAYLRVMGRFLFLAVFFCLRPVWAVEIYSFVDEKGVVHLTDRPNDSRYRPVILKNADPRREQSRPWLVTKTPARVGGERPWQVTTVPVVDRSRASDRRLGDRAQAGGWVSVDRSRSSGRGSSAAWNTTEDATSRWRWSAAQTPEWQKSQPEWQKSQFEPLIHDAARRNGLNSALLRSIIRAESDFDPNAVSPKGAVGLMQLMPETARSLGVQDSTDPEANINGGARFLASLLKRFDNDLELSLAAYNAGPTAVDKYGRSIPPYPETQQYVSRVMRYYREYRQFM